MLAIAIIAVLWSFIASCLYLRERGKRIDAQIDYDGLHYDYLRILKENQNLNAVVQHNYVELRRVNNDLRFAQDSLRTTLLTK